MYSSNARCCRKGYTRISCAQNRKRQTIASMSHPKNPENTHRIWYMAVVIRDNDCMINSPASETNMHSGAAHIASKRGLRTQLMDVISAHVSPQILVCRLVTKRARLPRLLTVWPSSVGWFKSRGDVYASRRSTLSSRVTVEAQTHVAHERRDWTQGQSHPWTAVIQTEFREAAAAGWEPWLLTDACFT